MAAEAERSDRTSDGARGERPRARQPTILVLVALAAVLGSLPIDTDRRVRAASAGSLTAATSSADLPPVQIVLDDAGFSPSTVSVARGQTIWVDNAAGSERTVDIGTTLSSGPIPAGGRFAFALPATGPFTLTDDAPSPHTGTVNVGQPTLAGASTANAAAAIPDLVPPVVELDEHPNLTLLHSRNRILIGVTAIASIGQVNAALDANGLMIVGGIPTTRLLVTEPIGAAGPTDHAALQALLDDLRTRPGISTAAWDIAVGETDALPRPPLPEPTTNVTVPSYASAGDYGDWELGFTDTFGATGVGSNWGLEASRFPQVWNLRDEVRRRSPLGPGVDTVVVDEGFDTSHPDLAQRTVGGSPTVHRLCTVGETFCTDMPIDEDSGRPASSHGNLVAATIGATFDRGDPGPNSSGVVGANPEADLHLVPFADRGVRTDVVHYHDFLRTLALVLEQRPTKFPQLRAINLSLGSVFVDGGGAWNRRWGDQTCGPGADDDRSAPQPGLACTPNNLDLYLREWRPIAELSRPLAEAALNASVAIVTSAGNDGGKFCSHPRPTPSSPCSQPAVLDAINKKPLAWIDHTWSLPGSSRTSPILVVEAHDQSRQMASYSDRGTISAPGTVFGPVVLPDGSPWYQYNQGTSFAAPHVTAAVGYLAALSPTTPIDTLVRHLRERGRTDLTGTPVPRLDAFEAAISLPGVVDRLVDVNDASVDGNERTVRANDGSVLGDNTVRTGTVAGPIASAPDGRVDMRDFRVFRDAMLFACLQTNLPATYCPDPTTIDLDGGPTHPKKDTNLDGCFIGTGVVGCDLPEESGSRLDVNGDGSLGTNRVRVPLTPSGAVAPPGSGTQMDDLDVLASRWGTGVGADTNGYRADQLRDLLNSTDVQLRFDQLWAEGATSADVVVTSSADPAAPVSFTVSRPTSSGQVPWRTVTVPLDPAAGVDNFVQARVTATLPFRDEPAVFLTPLLDAKIGGDLVVSPCSSQLTITADPEVPDPGGSSTITARLIDCLGNGIADEELTFEITDGPMGAQLSPVSVITDAEGVAATTFTMPSSTLAGAEVTVTAYPALAGEPLRASVAFGEDLTTGPGVQIYFNAREIVEDYERVSSNDWGEDADDCDGPIDATGSPAGCFFSTQRFGFPDRIEVDPGVIAIDRRGVISLGSNAGDASITTETRIFGGPESPEPVPGQSYDFVPLVTAVSEWPASNIAAVESQEVFSNISITSLGRSGQDWSDPATTPLPEVTHTLDASGLRVFGLSSFNDDFYFSSTRHEADGYYPDLHPDVPIGQGLYPLGRHRQQIPTQLGLLERIDGTAFPFAADVDGPLTIRRSADGSYETYTYCARNDRSLVGGGGYWSDASPLRAWGRDPDDQRLERQPGDRAAPLHSGYVRGRVSFVAVVSLDGSPPPAGALDAPPCNPSGLDARFSVVPTSQGEGRVVRFAPATGRLGVDEQLSYQWIFGDGNESTEATPEHVYEDSGDYVVTLVVEDADGGIGIESRVITITNSPPTLTLDAVRPTAGGVELDVTVGEWSAVDGLGVTVVVTGSGAFPVVPATPYPIGSHTIPIEGIAPGTYTVQIIALDKDGGATSRTIQLTVAASAPTAAPAPQPFRSAAAAMVDEPTPDAPAISGFRAAASALVAQATPSDPLAGVAVPAFVLSRVTATTDDTVDIRNASISAGSLVGTVFDLGDGRSSVPIDAGATRAVTFSAAGDVVISTTLAGVTTHSALRVTGAAIVPVVALDPANPTTGFVGQSVVVRATVTAQGSSRVLPGRPVTFRIGTTTADAVTDATGVAEAALTLTDPAGATTLEVTAAATDGDAGASTTAPFTVLPNAAPTASAGGPYDVPILGDLVLEATGTDADDAGALAFAWDLDDDGAFDDAVGPEPLVPAAQVAAVICGGECRPDQVDDVNVRVTDPKGASATATTTVRSVADFTLGLSPGVAALGPGQQASIRVDVRTFNGFDGLVTLTAPSLPPGVTATFSPASVRPNGESVLTLVASTTASPTTDPVPLVVRGTAGSLVRETTGSIDLEFALVPRCTGSVTGRVTNALTGEPVVGVFVTIGNTATTDADGRYLIEGIPVSADNGPRLYDVIVTPAVGGPTWVTQGRNTFVSCTTTTFDVALTPELFGTVTGTVRFADQNGVVTPFVPPTTGTTPQVQMSTRTGNRSAPLDAQGRYRFDNVPLNVPNQPTPVSPRIQFTGRHLAQSTATVRAGEQTVVDLVATQVCTGSIRARVIDSVTGLTRANARVRYGSTASQLTNANGVVVLTGVPLGAPDNRAIDYTVTALGPTGDNRSVNGRVTIPRCGAITPIDLRLPAPTVPTSATLRATILDEETGLPVQGVTVRTSNGATSPNPSGPDGVVSWVISLGTSSSASVVASTASNATYYASPTQNVTLTAGQTRNVEFRILRRQFGVVSGTVTDAFTGEPLPGVAVNDGTATTTTDENGRYELTGLPLNAGNQPTARTVRARPDADRYWERTVTATVAAAPPATTVDFALVPVCQGATVRGRVISASTGLPIEGASVNIAGLQQSTGADGRFAFTDLRVGSQNTPATWGINASAPGFVTASRTVTIFCGADIVVDFGAPTTTAVIAGRVTDEAGDPVSGVFVGTGFGGSAVTDTNGEYLISGVPAPLDGSDGEWSLSFQPPFGSGLQDASRTAAVRASQTTTVDVTLLATGGEPPNQRPTAAISGPAAAVEGETVILTATGSDDADGAITTVQWDLDGDGSFETTAAGTDSEVTVTRSDDATVTVGLRVTDDGGAAAGATRTLRFANAAPVITLNDDLVVDGARVTRTGSVADVGTADTHTATIDVDTGDGPVALALTPNGPGRYTFVIDAVLATTGLRTSTVSVCDDDHAPGAVPPVDGCDTESFDVTIDLPNRPPVATAASVTTRADQPVSIVLAGTDPDGDDLTAAIVDGPTSGVLSGTPPNLLYTPNLGYVGPDLVTFTVSDGESTSAPAEIAITVTAANVAPTAVVSGPTEAVEGDTVTLTALGSTDVDGTIALVEWDLDGDGTHETPAAALDTPVSVTRSDDGTVTIGLRVTDDEGAADLGSHVVQFANAVPVVTLGDDLTVTDGRLTRTGTVADAGSDDTQTATIDVDTSDADGPQTLTLVPSGSGRWTFAVDHTYPTPGPRTVSITVCDDDHDPTAIPPVDGCATTTFVVDVPPPRVNQPPTAVITGPTSALEGETVVLSAAASTDDRSITSFAWDIGGDGSIEGTGLTQAITARDDGPITVALEVTDDEGAVATTTHVVTFRDVPAEIVLGDDLVLAADGTLTRTGRIVDPGADDRHVVTVDWGDGSATETVAVTNRTFELRHRYESATSLRGALSSDALLQETFVVVVTVCDVAAPTACGTGSFDVGGEQPPPPPTADLAVLVRPVGTLSPGARIQLGVTVTNSGPSAAADVVVVLTLPAGTSTPGVQTDGWRCLPSSTNGIVRCSFLASSLPVGAWALVVPVDIGMESTGPVQFAATVESSTTDPTTSNNRATRTGDILATVVPTSPVAPTSPAAPTPTPPPPPGVPTGELPETGSTGLALQLQLAAVAAALGLVVRGATRRRTRG